MADLRADFFDPNTGRLNASATMAGFVCRKSGTKNTQARLGGNTNPSTLLIDVTGVALPIVALKAAGYAAALGSAYTNLGVDYHNFASNAPVGTTFNYWIFDYATALPAHTAEFMLRHPTTGAITFSNRYWPLKAPAVLAGSVSEVPGRTLAYACAGLGGHYLVQSAQCHEPGQVPTPDLEGCSRIETVMDGKRYGGRHAGGIIERYDVSYDDTTGFVGDYAAYLAFGDGWTVDNTVLLVDVTNIPANTTFF